MVGAVNRQVPSTAYVLMTLMGVAWKRLMRSRSWWVVLGIALAPMLFALGLKGRGAVREAVGATELFVMALLPSVFVGASVGEEIEDRTSTYLWSRPIARWTVIVGKLMGLAPLAAAIVAVDWWLSIRVGTGAAPSLQSTLAFASGAVAVSAIAAGIALLVPKHGMALSIVYLVLIDMIIGAIPASLQTISITRQVRLLADIEHAPSLVAPAITMLLVACLWLVIGLLRLRRLES